MNTPFKLEIVTHNYETGEKTYVNNFSLNDLAKFSNFLIMLKKNLNYTQWNWFNILPSKWNGTQYELDRVLLKIQFQKKFGFNFEEYLKDSVDGPINSFKEFFSRFTPDGADAITGIHLYEVKEIEIN